MTNYFPTFLPLFVVIVLVVMRRPIGMLRRRGAVSPETAQPLDDLSAADRQRLERLRARGLVREAAPGRFYYDREAERVAMRRRMPWLIALIVVLLGIFVWMVWIRPPHVQPLP